MRTIRRPLACLAFLALLLAGMDSRAAEPTYPTTMAGLPDGVRELLARREGGMADVGGPFSQWCERKPGTFHARLVSAEVRPDKVLVRYERGGIAGARPHEVEFTRDGETWTEVVQHTRLTWNGRPRAFGPVTGRLPAPAP
jgi:hypothetical protein